jgi:hypothetical protein
MQIVEIKLESGAHDSPDKGMCVMEAVSYIAGESFSDHPVCACPVISAFLRSYNDSVSDEVRQCLKPFIPRLVGTKSTPEVEERRSLIAADWLVRTHTPAWLRLAGLNAQADALSGLPEIISMAQVPSIRGPIEAARRDAAAAGAAARAAAWAAAGAAAWAAAGAAAWDAAMAAAGDAAWDAAGAAARAAAGDAAGDAAWDAAWDAAGAAARDAAGAAARDAAGAAAGDAARDAAGAAARAAARAAATTKLAPTVAELQATVPALIERMLAVQ